MTGPSPLLNTSAPAVPDNWDRSGLPAWAYNNTELMELEKELLFRCHWQLAGHVANIPEHGDFFTFDIVGERAVILRGRDGVVRAFHNVCRHRGSRVVAEKQGTCKSALFCPFHGWSFNLDGTFRSAPMPRSLPELDPVQHGLIPVEMDIWHGFIFIRFKPGPQPSITQIMARHEQELAPYRPADLVADGGFWQDDIAVNWKCVRDVDNEGYHVPMAHPALQDLYGKHYFDEAIENGTNRSFASFNEGDPRLWSVRHYKKLLPDMGHLPPSHRTAWLYIGIFPNMVIEFRPECISFYQEFPRAVDDCFQRGASYSWAGQTREAQAARYLGNRINRDTQEEDVQLIIWSHEAMSSSGYEGFILSDMEYGVRSYHDELRRLMPVLNEESEPAPGTIAPR
jgi:phenylpropionate dioxygenase-like ring-hydroxylating dioxygenase large terminal subunit